MIFWRHRRRVGQAEPDPGEAAGAAAKEEALKAEWPPTRNNAEAIGKAAGTAAGAAACAALGAPEASPLCGAIGGAVGDYVGAAVYDLLDSFFGVSDLTRRALDETKYRAVLNAELEAAIGRLSALSGSDRHTELEALKRWGYPIGIGYTWGNERVGFLTTDKVSEQLKRLLAAESARAAEIQTKRQLSGGSSVGKALAVAIVGGLAVALLQKVIFR